MVLWSVRATRLMFLALSLRLTWAVTDRSCLHHTCNSAHPTEGSPVQGWCQIRLDLADRSSSAVVLHCCSALSHL